MKHKITFTLIGLLVYAGFLLTLRPTLAVNSNAPRAVVILRAQEQWITTDQGGGHYASVPTGIGVLVSSSSSNAPSFNPTNQYVLRPLAQALADLLDAGYRIEHIDGPTFTYTLVR